MYTAAFYKMNLMNVNEELANIAVNQMPEPTPVLIHSFWRQLYHFALICTRSMQLSGFRSEHQTIYLINLLFRLKFKP